MIFSFRELLPLGIKGVFVRNALIHILTENKYIDITEEFAYVDYILCPP